MDQIKELYKIKNRPHTNTSVRGLRNFSINVRFFEQNYPFPENNIMYKVQRKSIQEAVTKFHGWANFENYVNKNMHNDIERISKLEEENKELRKIRDTCSQCDCNEFLCGHNQKE